MVLNVLAVSFLVIIMMLIIYAVKCFTKKRDIGYLLGHLLMGCALILVSYTANFVSPFEEHMKVFLCLERFFTVWTLYFMTLFVFSVEGHSLTNRYRTVSFVVITVDSLMVLTNFINEFVFEFHMKEASFATYMALSPKPLFVLHCLICVAMISTMVLSIIRKIMSSPYYYRPRYMMFILTLVAIILANTIFNFTNSVIDISRFMYGIGAFLFYFATFKYKPHALLHELQDFVNDSINDAVVMYDMMGNVIQNNERAAQMFEPDILSKKDAMVEFLGGEEKVGKTTKEIDGKIYEILYNPLYDKESMYIASVFIFFDVTENKKQIEREHSVAIHDPLTGCYNRMGFLESAKPFLFNNILEGDYAVMSSGISNFKGINGLYGTRVGDRVLKEIERRLCAYHYQFPMLYGRTAEGKFSCIIPMEYVDKIAKELSRIPISLDDGVDIHVDMSHGYVVMTDHSKSVEYYYELSLLALAKCKQTMTSPMMEYSQDMEDEQLRKQLLLSAMHDAIDRREFFIELQPQINLETNRVVGAEALVRWNHPSIGRIPPNEFIPLFENNGFISKLDRFVWTEAAAVIRRLSDSGLYDGSISVNVSQVDITNMNVAEEFEHIVKRMGIPPEKLHVEITESACVNNRDDLNRTLVALREKGFIVEIDDFGSGYSSLNALVHIPFDVVKLDMMFMTQSEKSEKDEIIMSAICNMIHDLKAGIIVEGVETIENVETVNHLGADVAQGYHYSRPLSIEKFIDYVRKYNI